jgi:lysophospholipase L1-like esterase
LLVALATAVTAVAVIQTDVAKPTKALSVLFVGDSFTAGAGLQDTQTYPTLVARTANWDVHVDAQGATGFIEDGRGTGNGDTSRLIDRLAEDGRRFPRVDLLIIDAGRNDLDHPTDEFAGAVSEYLTAAQRQWPTAKIVAILPSYVRSCAYDTYPDLLEKLNARLSAVNGTLVDPIAEGWYANANLESMLSRDEVHPNYRGSAYIAERLIASLRSKGIIRAGPSVEAR